MIINDAFKLSVTDTGAVPGSDALQTEAFQKALDEAYSKGGGTVTVPSGRYRIGSVRIRSNTTLHLLSGAQIYASRDPEDYSVLENDDMQPIPDECRTDKLWEKSVAGMKRDYSFMKAGGRWNHGIFRAFGAENIAVIGEKGSLIDGCNCYDETGEEHYRGPHGMNFHLCSGVKLSGYTIRKTGNWAHAIYDSKDIDCRNVTVLGGHDGIHLTRCEDIVIENCIFRTGDDCIAGFANLRTRVSNCVLNTACSAFRFGGTDMLAENCSAYGPAEYFFRGSLTKEEKAAGAEVASSPRTNMLSFFTYYADHSFEIPVQPGNIVFRNISVKNSDRFIHYNFSGSERWQCNRPLKSVSFENVSAQGLGMPLLLYGDEKVPVEFGAVNCAFAFRKDAPEMPFLKTAYFGRISLKNVTVKGRKASPFALTWSDPGIVDTVNVNDPADRSLSFVRSCEQFHATSI